MKPQTASEIPVEELVLRELRSLRGSVAGIRGSIVTTSDGLLVAHDISGMDPSRIAAIVATTLGLASQATHATGLGPFREAVARGTVGYLVVYAAGRNAVVAVIGDSGLNVGMLHYEMRDMVRRITDYSSKFPRWGGQHAGGGTSWPRTGFLAQGSSLRALTSISAPEPSQYPVEQIGMRGLRRFFYIRGVPLGNDGWLCPG